VLAASGHARAHSRQARAQRTDYEVDDVHFHLTNYIQEGTDIRDFLKLMGTRVGRVALFGIPLQQTWSHRISGNYPPAYYLQSDAPLYYYSFTDAAIANAYLSLPPDGNDSNISQTGWYDIGGTSLSCPQWAGLVAIADQLNKAKYGQTGLGLINPALYKLASQPAKYAADYFDVAHTAIAGVANDNQEDPSIPGYPATQGWDPVTGLGTPNAAALIPDLVDAAHS